jgi:hypothetical protein
MLRRERSLSSWKNDDEDDDDDEDDENGKTITTGPCDPFNAPAKHRAYYEFNFWLDYTLT